MIGKKTTESEILEVYDAAGVFSHANQWEYFYFINTKPFNTVYVEELYTKDINKGEKISAFVYKIKNRHSNNSEKSSSLYKFIRNGNEYYFYYAISV